MKKKLLLIICLLLASCASSHFTDAFNDYNFENFTVNVFTSSTVTTPKQTNYGNSSYEEKYANRKICRNSNGNEEFYDDSGPKKFLYYLYEEVWVKEETNYIENDFLLLAKILRNDKKNISIGEYGILNISKVTQEAVLEVFVSYNASYIITEYYDLTIFVDSNYISEMTINHTFYSHDTITEARIERMIIYTFYDYGKTKVTLPIVE